MVVLAWQGGAILGRTPIGRVTVIVLALNQPERVAMRIALIAEGLIPEAS